MTNNKCAGGCQAEWWMPETNWVWPGETPHCEGCEAANEVCHYCRWNTDPPEGSAASPEVGPPPEGGAEAPSAISEQSSELGAGTPQISEGSGRARGGRRRTRGAGSRPPWRTATDRQMRGARGGSSDVTSGEDEQAAGRKRRKGSGDVDAAMETVPRSEAVLDRDYSSATEDERRAVREYLLARPKTEAAPRPPIGPPPDGPPPWTVNDRHQWPKIRRIRASSRESSESGSVRGNRTTSHSKVHWKECGGWPRASEASPAPGSSSGRQADRGAPDESSAEEAEVKIKVNCYPVWIVLCSGNCSHVGWTHSRKDVYAHTGLRPDPRAVFKKFPETGQDSLDYWKSRYGRFSYVGIPKLPKRCDSPWHERAKIKVKPTKCKAYVVMEPVDPAAEAEGVYTNDVMKIY